MASEDVNQKTAGQVCFGPFVLSVPSRLLLRDNEPVQIGSCSLDILIALVESAGAVVSKAEIMRRVWSGTVVDEGNLRVHMNGLRKALGDGHDGARYVANVVGRGYSFVAPVSDVSAAIEVRRGPLEASHTSLPSLLDRMVGRDDVVDDLASQVLAKRFVSLVGPGGIGKTTVAVAASHRLRDEFGSENVYFVNLGPISDANLVHATIASMLGVPSQLGDPAVGVRAFLQRRKALLVLDSCEHVVEPVAALTEKIFGEAPLAHLLTTTREALRVEGEHVTRLPPLQCPPAGAVLTAPEALAFPAVELFVERAAANAAGFRLTDEDAPVVADICRKLDGIALAIELGAGRVEAYGLEGMAQLLDGRLQLLWHGKRTAPPRHQTLNAMLDWSYNLLPKAERSVFRQVAVFAGDFTLDGARAVVSDVHIETGEVVEIIAGLVTKSLVSPTIGRSSRSYRLLDTARTYALTKLDESGHRHEAARRHAQFFTAAIEMADERRQAAFFLENLENIRSALSWSFADHGDPAIGVALTTATASLFLEHSLLGECHRWTERAIACLGDGQRGTEVELELQTSLGWSAMFAKGRSDDIHGAFRRGLEIAESLGHPKQQLQLIGGMNIFMTRISDFAGALELAQRGVEVARRTDDELAIMLADWLVGVCHHLCGNQAVVERYCNSARRRLPASTKVPRSHFGYDHRGRALVARARSLWLRGYPAQAIEAAHFAIEEADELEHPVSLCIAMVYSATVFIWAGDWAAADATIDRLIEHARTHTLIYRDIGLALRGQSLIRRGDFAAGAELLRRSLMDLRLERHDILATAFRTSLSEGLLALGRREAAGVEIDFAAESLGPLMSKVDGPEVLRVKAMVLGSEPGVGTGEAQRILLQALELAQRQSALSWELRASMGLVRIRTSRGLSSAAALSDLAQIYHRFSEGFDTADLKEARVLLQI